MFIKVSFKQFHVDYTIHLNFVLFQSELKISFKKFYTLKKILFFKTVCKVL